MEYLFGVLVSVLVRILSNYFDTDGIVTAVILIALSVVGAGAYVYLLSAGYWEAIASVLITAGAFHNFVIRTLDKTVK